MRTTVDIPDPLFRRVKAKAALQGQSLKEFVTESLRNQLESPPSEAQLKQQRLQRQIEAAKAFTEIARRSKAGSGAEGRTWRREDAYDR